MIHTQWWSVIVSQLRPVFARQCGKWEPTALTALEIATIAKGVALKDIPLSVPIWIIWTDNSVL